MNPWAMADGAGRRTAEATASAVSLMRIGMNFPLRTRRKMTAQGSGVNCFIAPNSEGLTGFFARRPGSLLSEGR
jgi:hypothetical protein